METPIWMINILKSIKDFAMQDDCIMHDFCCFVFCFGFCLLCLFVFQFCHFFCFVLKFDSVVNCISVDISFCRVF